MYLPLAGPKCCVELTYRNDKIDTIGAGQAFDAAQWDQISREIDTSILIGPLRVGRDLSFSSFRVSGSWRGNRSGVQILPPPDEAPRAPVEIARHPFILEFPIQSSDFWPVTNYRRIREHHKLTLLLNVLLRGHTSYQPLRSEHFWALVDDDIRWVQQFFFAKLGEAVIDEISPPANEQIQEIAPEEYHAERGHDRQGLRVPADLDDSILRYGSLSQQNRTRFDRATFWLDLASRYWNIAVSSSFAALVSAIESLTERGDIHHYNCPECGKRTQHETPGATQRFRDFLETYAAGTPLAARNKMYTLRSGILHGSTLMQLDQDLSFGNAPLWWNEWELHDELWRVTRVALRNWLRNPT